MSNKRRTFLKVLAAGPLLACAGTSLDGGSGGSGSGGGSGGFGGSGVAIRGDVAAGNVSATRVGTLSVVPNSPIILGRDAQGLYAMTIRCPHQGCYVIPQGSGLVCPCHGSLFDSNGNVLQGPANSPLVHFAVSADAAGDITVHSASLVAPAVRTPV